MTALLTDGPAELELAREDLTSGLSEKELQRAIFAHPGLVPLDRIDPGAGRMIPICQEFPLPKLGGNVRIDILGVTPAGKIVIVECKLWRNPQARREVVAQILEYASLMRKWSFADLTARLSAALGTTSQNPLFDIARTSTTLSEAAFSDAVGRSLRTGDFDLIVAGDGIREDMAAIAEHLTQQGSRLALVEFQQWRDAAGRRLLVPHIPFRSEVVRHRMVTDPFGEPLTLTEEDEEATTLPVERPGPRTEQQQVRAANRAFWQEFIDTVRFDHPDQPPARHGGNNWVRIPLPSPARYLNAYRLNGGVGLSLVAEPGSDVFERLAWDIEDLRRETDIAGLRSSRGSDGAAKGLFIETHAPGPTEADQLAWFRTHANRLVTALRDRLGGEADQG